MDFLCVSLRALRERLFGWSGKYLTPRRKDAKGNSRNSQPRMDTDPDLFQSRVVCVPFASLAPFALSISCPIASTSGESGRMGDERYPSPHSLCTSAALCGSFRLFTPSPWAVFSVCLCGPLWFIPAVRFGTFGSFAVDLQLLTSFPQQDRSIQKRFGFCSSTY